MEKGVEGEVGVLKRGTFTKTKQRTGRVVFVEVGPEDSSASLEIILEVSTCP